MFLHTPPPPHIPTYPPPMFLHTPHFLTLHSKVQINYLLPYSATSPPSPGILLLHYGHAGDHGNPERCWCGGQYGHSPGSHHYLDAQGWVGWGGGVGGELSRYSLLPVLLPSLTDGAGMLGRILFAWIQGCVAMDAGLR